MEEEEELEQLQDACATLIQAIYRGHKARSFSSKLRAEMNTDKEENEDEEDDDEEEENDALKEAVCVIVQSLVRGFMARRRFAVRLQSEKEKISKQVLERERLRLEAEAAEAKAEEESLHEAVATYIQSITRGMFARRELSRLRTSRIAKQAAEKALQEEMEAREEEESLKEAVATLIQAMGRGMLARNKVIKLKEDKRARVLAEKEAIEAARVLAEQEAIEAARVLAEQEAIEAARVLAEQEAIEAARVLAEQEAIEAAR
jgi:hypothetical protein